MVDSFDMLFAGVFILLGVMVIVALISHLVIVVRLKHDHPTTWRDLGLRNVVDSLSIGGGAALRRLLKAPPAELRGDARLMAWRRIWQVSNVVGHSLVTLMLACMLWYNVR